jgi:hypothetical protein
MKTFGKIVLWGFISIIGIVVLMYIIGTSSSEEYAESKKKLAEKHCKINYQESSNKAELLKQVINDPDINTSSPFSIAAGKLLKNSVKYPSTIQINGDKFDGFLFLNEKNTVNIDTLAGTWTYVVNFISENKLSQKVKSQMVLDMKYDAGCKPVKIINFAIE